MSIELSNLSAEQLLYLKQKWSAEMRELELDQSRATERLETRLERRASNTEELDALEDKLASAQTLLDHLQNTSAPSALITAQEVVVNDLQKSYDSQSRGSGVLTDEEAVLQQVTIDELALRKTYRADKIAEADAILNP